MYCLEIKYLDARYREPFSGTRPWQYYVKLGIK